MGKVKCVLQLMVLHNPWDGLGAGFSPSKVMPRDARGDVNSFFPHFSSLSTSPPSSNFFFPFSQAPISPLSRQTLWLISKTCQRK